MLLPEDCFAFINDIHKNATHDCSGIIPPGKNQALLVTSTGDKYELDQAVNIEDDNIHVTNANQELVYTRQAKQKVKKQVAFNTIIIPKGGEYRLTLMDGTKVCLNSNSKLKYPSEFGSGNRYVQLEGEAYFEVAKDPDHPFVVDVNNMQIKVLGTAFNVNAYAKENKIVNDFGGRES